MANAWGYPSELDSLASAADAAALAVAQIGSYGGGEEAMARQALGAFWNLKAELYRSFDQIEQRDADKLDLWVKNLWARMAQQLSFMAAKDNPSASMRYVQEAKQASAASQALAVSTNQQGSRLAASAAQVARDSNNQQTYNDANAIDARYSTAFWDQTKKVLNTSFLGVPTWIWLAGAAAVGVAIFAGPEIAGALASRRRRLK